MQIYLLILFFFRTFVANLHMKATVEYIERRFAEYNVRFFGGSLPPVPVRLSHAKGFLGKLSYQRCKQGLFGRYRNEGFVLRINVRIDLPEELVEDTILHEMIHYYIAVNQIVDSSSHGKIFRQEMERINREGNRHITLSHKLNEEQQSQAHVHKSRVVAVVHFADGKTGIKVVPKQQRHLLYWHKTSQRCFPIRSIEWYYTNDEYFAKYPSSVAMKIFLVSPLTELPLRDAKKIEIEGSHVYVID